MTPANNHAIEVICLFAVWTIVLLYMGGKAIFMDYDGFKDTEKDDDAKPSSPAVPEISQ